MDTRRLTGMQDGHFHFNTYLTVSLKCPHFLSGEPVEDYEMMVMKHKEDGTFAFGIDEFPVMNEDAVEQFYIQKVMQDGSTPKTLMMNRLRSIEC